MMNEYFMVNRELKRSRFMWQESIPTTPSQDVEWFVWWFLASLIWMSNALGMTQVLPKHNQMLYARIQMFFQISAPVV